MLLLSTKQLQKELGISLDMAYVLMRSKAFPRIKVGGRYYITQEALNTWLASYQGRDFHIRKN